MSKKKPVVKVEEKPVVKSEYVVADGMSLTSKRGIIGAGKPISQKDVACSIQDLIDKEFVVKG